MTTNTVQKAPEAATTAQVDAKRSTLPVGTKRDGTEQKRSNQWLKRKEQNGIPERDRDRHRAECAAALLDKHLMGTKDLSPTQVQAAKILMDKGKPSLQAVEQTMVEPAMRHTEAEILNDLRAFLSQRPELLKELIGEQAQLAGALPNLVGPVDVNVEPYIDALQQDSQPIDTTADASQQTNEDGK